MSSERRRVLKFPASRHVHSHQHHQPSESRQQQKKKVNEISFILGSASFLWLCELSLALWWWINYSRQKKGEEKAAHMAEKLISRRLFRRWLAGVCLHCSVESVILLHSLCHVVAGWELFSLWSFAFYYSPGFILEATAALNFYSL